MRRFSFFLTIPFALSLVALPCQAGAFLNTLVATGEVNTYEDQSRETLIDVDQSGGLSNGDVIIGFLRLDNRITPVPPAVDSLPGNGAYLGFSQQVTNVVRTDLPGLGANGAVSYTWSLAPTTVAGLTFDELAGTGGTPVGTIGRLYEDTGIDLIGTSPGDLNGNGLLDVGDFLMHLESVATALITTGFTLGNQPPEFQEASSFQFKTLGGDGNGNIVNDNFALLDFLPLGSPAGATFDLGFTILENFTGLTWVNVPTINPTVGPVLNEFGVVSGDTSGANNANYFDAGLGGNQTNVFSNSVAGGPGGLTSADYYGAADNANVLVAAVPEPGTYAAFLALGVVAFGARRRRRRNNK